MALCIRMFSGFGINLLYTEMSENSSPPPWVGRVVWWVGVGWLATFVDLPPGADSRTWWVSDMSETCPVVDMRGHELTSINMAETHTMWEHVLPVCGPFSTDHDGSSRPAFVWEALYGQVSHVRKVTMQQTWIDIDYPLAESCKGNSPILSSQVAWYVCTPPPQSRLSHVACQHFCPTPPPQKKNSCPRTNVLSVELIVFIRLSWVGVRFRSNVKINLIIKLQIYRVQVC